MKGLKEIIIGIGVLISGVLGVAIGNLEETLFYSSSTAILYILSVYVFYCTWMDIYNYRL